MTPKLGLTLMLLTCAAPLARAQDPPVPPAQLMATGVPVALIGDGIDYTRSDVARRILRDGEGEIVGYDFKDDDRRPYAGGDGANDAAGIILGQGQVTTLVPIRADRDGFLSFSKSLAYAGRSPAVIVVAARIPDDRRAVVALAAAARRFHDRLFVAAGGSANRNLDADWPQRLHNLPNLIVVTAHDGQEPGPALPNYGATSVDLAAPGGPSAGGSAAASHEASSLAASRVGALAARLRAVEPAIPATAMKVRLCSLAQDDRALSENDRPPGPVTRCGTILAPQRYFWME